MLCNTVHKYTTQREIISKIDLTGFSLRHLGMVVTIVTIISLTPVTFALYAKKIFVSRVCMCVTRNRLQCAEKKMYPSVREAM